jgi:large subunit ribosomal protein L1
MPKHGKKYRKAQELIDAEKLYSLDEAVALVKKTATTSFDATVEVHILTGANVKHADQIVRATVTLPAGTGKTKKIAVFCADDKAEEAKKAGADVVGADELIEKVQKGEIDFEVAIATPDMMKSLAKVARVLGPKGLMPSPKSGTVTTDIAKAVEELKKGKIEFRTDKTGIIHSILGKASFTEKDLVENAKTLFKSITDNKPSGVKGTYIRTVSISSSMGPGINIDPSEVSA